MPCDEAACQAGDPGGRLGSGSGCLPSRAFLGPLQVGQPTRLAGAVEPLEGRRHVGEVIDSQGSPRAAGRHRARPCGRQRQDQVRHQVADGPPRRGRPGVPVDQRLAELDRVRDAEPQPPAQRLHVARPALGVDHHPHRRHRPGELHQPRRRLPRPAADLGDEVPGVLPPSRLARCVGPARRDGAHRAVAGVADPQPRVVEQRLRPVPAVHARVVRRQGLVRGPPRVAVPGRLLEQHHRPPRSPLRVAQLGDIAAHRGPGRQERRRRVLELPRLHLDDAAERIARRADPLAGVHRPQPRRRPAQPGRDRPAPGSQQVEVVRRSGHQVGRQRPDGQRGRHDQAPQDLDITTPRLRADAGRATVNGPAGSTTTP